MARTMSDGREELIREVVAESVLRAESGGTLYAAPLVAELDAERAAHEATRNSIKTCPVCGEETSTVRGHLMAEELGALKARLALAEKYAAFGSAMFTEFWGDGEPTDIDGGTLQDSAITHGLLRHLTEAECAGPDAHCEFCEWKSGDPASECQCLMPTCAEWRAAK